MRVCVFIDNIDRYTRSVVRRIVSRKYVRVAGVFILLAYWCVLALSVPVPVSVPAPVQSAIYRIIDPVPPIDTRAGAASPDHTTVTGLGLAGQSAGGPSAGSAVSSWGVAAASLPDGKVGASSVALPVDSGARIGVGGGAPRAPTNAGADRPWYLLPWLPWTQASNGARGGS